MFGKRVLPDAMAQEEEEEEEDVSGWRKDVNFSYKGRGGVDCCMSNGTVFLVWFLFHTFTTY